MGQWDYKNYVLNVKVRENLTDTRAVEYMKSWDFTKKEWDIFENSILPFYNPFAERIIRFFITYDKINLCPDLYDSWEPLKELFDKNNICDPVARLSFPGSTLFAKKRRMFNIIIQNLNYGLVFNPHDKYKVIPSRKKIGEYLGNIQILISQNSKVYTFEQMQQIVDDMCKYLGTNYGLILCQETNEILYQHGYSIP